MLSRRSFLIGTGGLLTASFVRKATAFSQRAVRPFLLPPARKPEETLYVYRQDWKDYGADDYGDNEYEDNDYDAKWRVSLGPNQPFAPPVPTWREHLRSLGHSLDTRTTSTASAPSGGLSRKISTSASTALAGRTRGTTSLAPRRRHIICSRSSILVQRIPS